MTEVVVDTLVDAEVDPLRNPAFSSPRFSYPLWTPASPIDTLRR